MEGQKQVSSGLNDNPSIDGGYDSEEKADDDSGYSSDEEG